MGHLMAKVEKRLKKVLLISAVMGTIALCVAIISVTIDVTGRFIGWPVVGVEELNTLLIVVLVFLGIGYAQVVKRHIDIKIFTMRLNEKARSVLNGILLSVSLLIFVIFTYVSVLEAIRSTQLREYVHGAVFFPIYPTKWIVALGLAFLCFQILIDIYHNFEKITKDVSSSQQHDAQSKVDF